MLKYSVRKLLAMIPKMFVVTVILFFFLEISPGDPVSRMLGPEAYNRMPEPLIEAYRESLGLNRPAVIRYFTWLWDLLHGNLGYSMSTGQPIAEMLAMRMPYSMELNFSALVLSGIIGVVVGFLCAVFQRTPIDYLGSGISVLGVSMPDYFFAIIFMLFFSVTLGWFPTGGRMPSDVANPTLWQRLPYMVLPIGSMTFTMTCGLVRETRTLMVGIMNKDYIKTARAKGLTEFTINVKHVLRNTMSPLLSAMISRLPALFGGSIVIEQVFNYIGLGQLSLNASKLLDAPVCLFNITLTAVVTLVASTLMDIAVAAFDPRVRFE